MLPLVNVHRLIRFLSRKLFRSLQAIPAGCWCCYQPNITVIGLRPLRQSVTGWSLCCNMGANVKHLPANQSHSWDMKNTRK